MGHRGKVGGAGPALGTVLGASPGPLDALKPRRERLRHELAGDQPLNLSATAGSVSDMTLTLTNSGTADVEGAAMSATAPTGWEVKYDTPTVAVPAGKSVQVVAHVTPSSEAIAGDYVTTFKATAPVANASADVRVTIQTSLLWGVVGIGLIVLVLIGLWWTFQRYGRR